MLLQYNTDNLPLRKRGSATSAEVATAAAAAAVTAAAAAAASARGASSPRMPCKRKRREDEKGSSSSSQKNKQNAQQQQQARQEQLTILTSHFSPSRTCDESIEELIGLREHEKDLGMWQDADTAPLYSGDERWGAEHVKESSCPPTPTLGDAGMRCAVPEVLEADWIHSYSQQHPMKSDPDDSQAAGHMSPVLTPTGLHDDFMYEASDFSPRLKVEL